MDVVDNTEDHLSPINNRPLKFHINLFPRTKESAEHERNYMLEVLKALLPDNIYNITEKYILRCNYLKKEYVEMSKIEFHDIFQHFLSLDKRVYEVIVELGIFTPFHILTFDIKGKHPVNNEFYAKIFGKLGYDPIVLGGVESAYYLYSIAALITYQEDDYIMSDILCGSKFKQNIKSNQILDNIHMCIYSSPNYTSRVARANIHSKYLYKRHNSGILVGIMMYKGYVFCTEYTGSYYSNYCSYSTNLHLFKLLMILLGEIDSKRDDESNAEYFKRLSNYNVELSYMFTIDNITYEIARYFMYNDNINKGDFKSIFEIIYDNGRYIKHAKYITELVYGLYGLCRDKDIGSIICSINCHNDFIFMLLEMITEINKHNGEIEVFNTMNTSNAINYINENYASNPSRYYWKIYYIISTQFIENRLVGQSLELFIHLKLDKKTKNRLVRDLVLSKGLIFPSLFMIHELLYDRDYGDSEYYLYRYNIMRDTFRGTYENRVVNCGSCHESYLYNIYTHGGPIKWQENMILYTDIEKGVGLFSTLVKDIRRLIVQYVLEKSFDEMSPAEKYYYYSIYNGERFIYDSAISI
jgi:hypothetical protein